jgi:cyclohexadienyl dehydratase
LRASFPWSRPCFAARRIHARLHASASIALAQAPSPSRLDDIIKSGKLRVCTPGDYKPFSFHRPDGGYEGLDIDLVQAAAKSLGVEVEMVKSGWPTLMKDFVEKCDVAVGGISVTTDRQKTAFFTNAYMVNGKAPITKCENVAKFQTVADIDKPNVTVIENPAAATSASRARTSSRRRS